ncbi:PREDICTED: endonuclease domain-containing 1 protein-like [Calidris pugnax]|uniref:endonuclease domain-containing 1 protein-like n=1 Tax=Calidris pugnax TaxID=198806 RepID=UPI00071DF77B|nr:PREDICTED: endonuclease domain-containing 1 protein-like [Calidris pugnax]
MLLLLLLQVLASCLWLGRSEVVTSFQSCPQFFFQGTPPNNALRPNNPAWICQRYNNRYHFATLYNRDLRIPVYSAYLYQPGSGTRPNIWMVEPQLISSQYSNDMQTVEDLRNQTKVTLATIMNSQAISQDYRNLKDLNRGHLNPRCHQYDNDSMMATFTLTNIVPQNKTLNGGAWNDYEVKMMINETTGCTTTYVVVGAVPGNNYIARQRVNVPSYIWAGACCKKGNNQMKTWAVIAENDKNAVQPLTLGDLENRLTGYYGKGKVSLFHSDCPR